MVIFGTETQKRTSLLMEILAADVPLVTDSVTEVYVEDLFELKTLAIVKLTEYINTDVVERVI